jgi:hypothetical protein
LISQRLIAAATPTIFFKDLPLIRRGIKVDLGAKVSVEVSGGGE